MLCPLCIFAVDVNVTVDAMLLESVMTVDVNVPVDAISVDVMFPVDKMSSLTSVSW